jgi:hypothetical protein
VPDRIRSAPIASPLPVAKSRYQQLLPILVKVGDPTGDGSQKPAGSAIKTRLLQSLAPLAIISTGSPFDLVPSQCTGQGLAKQPVRIGRRNNAVGLKTGSLEPFPLAGNSDIMSVQAEGRH